MSFCIGSITYYSGTSHKQQPLVSGLDDHLREVVAYGKLH